MLPLSVQTARHEEMAAPWYAFDEENEHFLSLGEEIIIYSIYIYIQGGDSCPALWLH